ncbi:glycoside hydrolase family 43 protein [Saccharopolyspora sp. MS10]|uniref:glycoside hydrolase family 43 protein n=1 Tax=Saccharopolyspora sp. MS10 TaxID=3385973 RepID=UPI0039A3405B
MPRKCRQISLTAILLLLMSPTALAHERAERTELAVPAIGRNFPDPDVLTHDGQHYAYATNTAGYNVQLATATDAKASWEQRPDALPRLPPWVGPAETGSLNVWAPDVSERSDGSFLLYYTAHHTASGRQCIGAAVADSPEGPFSPTSSDPLICAPGQGDVIDPASFVDSDGSRYLLYKDSRGSRARSGPSTIHLRPVAADGLTQAGEDIPLLSADRPEESGVVEAPTLLRRPGGYVLLYSGNTFDSGRYFTNYATSSSPTGPFTKAPGALLSSAVLGGAVSNPGGQDVFADDELIAFHADLPEPVGDRGLWIGELEWDGLNPVLSPGSAVRARH